MMKKLRFLTVLIIVLASLFANVITAHAQTDIVGGLKALAGVSDVSYKEFGGPQCEFTIWVADTAVDTVAIVTGAGDLGGFKANFTAFHPTLGMSGEQGYTMYQRYDNTKCPPIGQATPQPAQNPVPAPAPVPSSDNPETSQIVTIAIIALVLICVLGIPGSIILRRRTA